MHEDTQQKLDRALRELTALRAAHGLLQRDFERLQEAHAVALARIEEKDAQIAGLKQELASEKVRSAELREEHDRLLASVGRLNERVAYFIRKDYVTSSERRCFIESQNLIPELAEALLEAVEGDDDPSQLALVEEANTSSDPAAPADQAAAAPSDASAEKTEKKRKRPAQAGGRKPIPEVFPRHQTTYEPPADHPALALALRVEHIGTRVIERYDLSQLDIHVNQMTCPVVKLTLPGGITTQQTLTPPSVIERGQVSDHFLAVSAVDKIADHLPCYRQEQRLARLGAEIPRAKLCRWMIALASYLLCIKEAMLDEMMQHAVLGIDDTVHRLTVPDQPVCKKGRIWAISAPSGIVYDFQQTRAGNWITQALGSYAGAIMGDAYSGHNQLLARPDITALFCWAHARRKFIESADKQRRTVMLDLIGKLYDIENDLRDQPPDRIAHERHKRAGPILAKIHETLSAWQADPKVLPKSGIGKAVNYVLSRWDGFKAYLAIDAAPIDNNRTEQGMRPNALHRKNSLFSASLKGAESYATLSSLIHSAKLHGLDPVRYLNDVLEDLHHQRKPAAQLTPAAYAAALDAPVEIRS